MRDDRDTDNRDAYPSPPPVVPAAATGMYGTMGTPMDAPPPLIRATDVNPQTLKLQELLDVNVDTARGYDEAVELVSEQPLVDLFTHLAKERRAQAEELARYLGDRGEHPEADGTFIAAIRRGWVKLKAAVAENDDLMILEEAEHLEDQIKDAYESAPVAEQPSDVQQMLSRHQKSIHASHARVRDLRDQLRAEAEADAQQ